MRRVSEEDHRVKLLAITETGLKRYRAIVPRVLDWEKDLIEGLDASEYRDLLFLLEKLKKQLKAMSAVVEPEQVAAGESGAAGGV